MKRLTRGLTLLTAVSLVGGIVTAGPVAVKADSTSQPVTQSSIPYLEYYVPNSPANYVMKDWYNTARAFDSFVFNFTQSGTNLPVAAWDDTHYNMNSTTFKMPTYITGAPHNTMPADGAQEALAALSAVLGGSLVGIDKSNQTGSGYSNVNFVRMIQTFKNSEGIISNNPTSLSGGQEFWYMLTPTLQFAALDSLYPGVTDMDTIMRTVSDKWYDAIVKMGGANVNFNYYTYNFTTNAPVTGPYSQPDAAAGAGLLMYYAYQKFGDAKFLNAATWCMQFLQNLSFNPLYEDLAYFAPLLGARLNAEQGQNNDIAKMLNWTFTDSAPSQRKGWGMTTGNWGVAEANGLLGSTTDTKGYAFSMNTFIGAMGLVPVARYDQQYARAIGKWMLNAASNSRFFYADALDSTHQDGLSWTGDQGRVVPYEGLRHYKRVGYSTPYQIDYNTYPFATGDAVGWNFGTNFGVYSGALSGVFGGMISTTNVNKILQLDLNKADFFPVDGYQTYLYYNPYETSQSVQIDVGAASKDLYDAVSDTNLKTNVSGVQSFTIAPDSAVVLVLAPANGTKTYSGQTILINSKFVGHRPVTNLASGKTATASSTVNGNVAAGVTDGTTATRWESATSDPQWIQVDLGSSKTVGKVVLNWEAAYAKTYQIQTSLDGTNWTNVYSTTAGTGGVEPISFSPVNARYVRMYGTARGTSWAYSLYEFGVYAPDDLARNRPVSASSTVNGNLPTFVVDGTTATRWESTASDPQWLQIDLGSSKTVGRTILRWEAAYGKTYQIQLSTDGTTWTNAYSTVSATGGVENITFTPTTARYVRLSCTQRGTTYAYSLYDLELYAN
ncbi:discoidin domain-containing protein [Gorillibacterium timonense]|uniref:discoidin domain-containing protein n=1 Tax=Gorillibacterium timonense TaxID=1689269 RepID=UPI00071E33CC|nr:discoidin domain-containing protein [Gorillibacterium timonense]